MAEVVPIRLYKEQDFTLGDLSVRPSLNRVAGAGKTVKLEPKVMKVLLVLRRAGGGVVTRDELIREVWEGQAVTDDAITRCISRLRRLFTEDFPGSVKIETVQKAGYRLITGEEAKAPASHRAFTKAGGITLLVAFAIALGISAWFSTRDRLPVPGQDILSQTFMPFTAYPGLERYPNFAPDGESVVFSWRNPEEGHYDLYRVDLQGEGRLRLTNHTADDIRAAWSPDGSRIAFGRFDGSGGCEILVIPAIGGAERKVADCEGRLVALDWARAGASLLLAYQRTPYGKAKLFLIDPATHEASEITLPDGFELGVDDAAFSPDGSQIALTISPTLGVEDIFVMARDGTGLRRLSERHLKVHGLAWLADGSGLLASTNWLGAFGLWLVPLDGDAPSPLLNFASGIDGLAVSPAGDVLVEHWQESASVFSFDLRTGEGTPLPLNSTRFDWDARPSPDGTGIAFVSDRSGSAELWVYQTDSQAFSKLTDFGGPWTHSPRWSPDGRHIVFTSPDRGRFNLYLVAASGGPLTHLTGNDGDNFAPAFSPDGGFVHFGSNRGGAWQIWRHALETGEQTQVTREGGRAPQVSPDGKWLYYTRIDESGLWRQPLSGGDAGPEQVVDDLTPVDWNNWHIGQDMLFYVRRPIPDRPELIALDLETREIRLVLRVPGLLHNSGLWVSTDGGRAWLTLNGEAGADLLLAASGN